MNKEREALQKILNTPYGYSPLEMLHWIRKTKDIATEALQSESEQPSPSIEKEEDFPLKIWANIYNPLKTASWDLHKSENAAVKNSIGAKTHLYIHESIANNHLDELEKLEIWIKRNYFIGADINQRDLLKFIQELKTKQ